MEASEKLSALLREYEEYWEQEEKSLERGEGIEAADFDWLRRFQKKSNGLSPLSDSESQYLLELGRTYLLEGLVHRMSELAKTYSYADGHPLPGMDFYSGWRIDVPNLSVRAHFEAYSLRPLLAPDERILYHDEIQMVMRRMPNFRIGCIFLTNKRFFVLGRRNMYDPRERSDILQLIYPDMEEKRYFHGLDFFELDRIRKLVTKKKRIEMKFHCTYALIKPTIIQGPLWVKFDLGDRTEVQTGEIKLLMSPSPFPEKFILDGYDEKKRTALLSSSIQRAREALESQSGE
ncbi:MAG: hypothetical protein ACE5H4_06015 [Candidatus Thorarchaeota archaeon]